jgi:hypothetical protein
MLYWRHMSCEWVNEWMNKWHSIEYIYMHIYIYDSNAIKYMDGKYW